jgi:hypothetical protein
MRFILAVAESAVVIAVPTAFAPGIGDLAMRLSFSRSVIVDRVSAVSSLAQPTDEKLRTAPRSNVRFIIGASKLIKAKLEPQSRPLTPRQLLPDAA